MQRTACSPEALCNQIIGRPFSPHAPLVGEMRYGWRVRAFYLPLEVGSRYVCDAQGGLALML
jgi:hypothetical protein